jgi:hypothetical protein
MPKWEYMAEECVNLEDLAALGNDGWELVAELPVLVPDPDVAGDEIAQPMLVFKRQLLGAASGATTPGG